jgi:hypothetical protein
MPNNTQALLEQNRQLEEARKTLPTILSIRNSKSYLLYRKKRVDRLQQPDLPAVYSNPFRAEI